MEVNIQLVHATYNRQKDQIALKCRGQKAVLKRTPSGQPAGIVVWGQEEAECANTVSQIYLGRARLHKYKQSRGWKTKTTRELPNQS